MPKATTTKVRIGRIERRAVPLIVLCFGLVGPGCTVVMVAPGDGGPGEPATDAGLPAADARPRPDGPPASCQIASCQNGNAATCTGERITLACSSFGASCTSFQDQNGTPFEWCDCGSLAEGRGRCLGRTNAVICEYGLGQAAFCLAGTYCVATDELREGIGCACDNQSDGICPDPGCIDDPDCHGSCTPDCSGRECGTDPVCGFSCGAACPMGKTCDSGRCVCKPNCSGRTCGSDGCGGQCGPGCAGGEICREGRCYCQPQCDGKSCGPDGCGDRCGAGCSDSERCDNGSCVPNPNCSCAGKQCGSDGCGGTCGPGCSAAEQCIDGTCVCVPKCDGKQCGPNGCGADCKPGCLANQICDRNGLCACVPQCDGKQCGPDGCDGQCGPGCAANQSCESGRCVCKPNCAGKQCGSDGCGGQCGPGCAAGIECVDGRCNCTPNCDGKSCGPNGCGGTCARVSPECPPGYGCIDGECQFDPCGGTCPPEKTCATHNSESACVAKPWALLTIGRPAGNGNYHRLFEEWLRDLPGNTSFSDRPHLECSAATDGFDDGLMISFADGAGKWEGLVGILPWTSDQTSWPVKYYITTTSGIGEVVDGRYLYDRGTTQLSPGYDCTASTDALTGGPEGWGLSFYVKCNAVRFGGTEELFFSLNGACTDFKRP